MAFGPFGMQNVPGLLGGAAAGTPQNMPYMLPPGTQLPPGMSMHPGFGQVQTLTPPPQIGWGLPPYDPSQQPQLGGPGPSFNPGMMPGGQPQNMPAIMPPAPGGLGNHYGLGQRPTFQPPGFGNRPQMPAQAGGFQQGFGGRMRGL
jgi:hypothetical protein